MSHVRVLIASGGSGGHIFPAVALARALKDSKSDIEIMFVGSSKELDRRIFEKEKFRYLLISANKLPYGVSFKLIPFFFMLKLDILRMLFLFASYRPNVVVGFGGYVSFPAIFAAYILNVPKIIHEQNVVPGRANKVLFKLANKVALSFDATKKFMGDCVPKAVITGNPIRREMLNGDRSLGIKKFGLEDSKFTVLVVGGSQGAHALNEKFIGALSAIDESVRRSMQVIHITGVKDYKWAVGAYSGIRNLEHRVFSFIDRIEEAYSASDLVVTRAGASAIFEVAAFAKPMILVPYPYAIAHQAENARVFSERGAAIQIDEKELSAEVFKNSILKLFNDRTLVKNMAGEVKRLAVPGASDALAREVLKVCEK
ncbi:MAG: undecaprenyldiphospho-muramoylpentapeptide beta-N-acetylglucosaminyltransferase [Candidatus Omnitrophota bacterium]|jgi:UDP-N-acetylglucosamine--N-acetylmuramyl-(pentapeptide) pyrophosphoryl-undecaprenol N-acetylglucosamine transferase